MSLTISGQVSWSHSCTSYCLPLKRPACSWDQTVYTQFKLCKQHQAIYVRLEGPSNSGCSTPARYSDMHCSNCSQTLLQRFNDAVITFIRQEKYRMKVIIASLKRCNKVCEQLSSACPNIDQAIIVTCTHQTTQSHRLAGLWKSPPPPPLPPRLVCVNSKLRKCCHWHPLNWII